MCVSVLKPCSVHQHAGLSSSTPLLGGWLHSILPGATERMVREGDVFILRVEDPAALKLTAACCPGWCRGVLWFSLWLIMMSVSRRMSCCVSTILASVTTPVFSWTAGVLLDSCRYWQGACRWGFTCGGSLGVLWWFHALQVQFWVCLTALLLLVSNFSMIRTSLFVGLCNKMADCLHYLRASLSWMQFLMTISVVYSLYKH